MFLQWTYYQWGIVYLCIYLLPVYIIFVTTIKKKPFPSHIKFPQCFVENASGGGKYIFNFILE